MDTDERGSPATELAPGTAVMDPILERFPLPVADPAVLPPEADLVSTVAHELLQPLTVIRGLLQMGLRSVGKDPERERASLQASIQHLDRMAQLIRDLLDLAAPASGLAVRLAPFDLPTVIAHAIGAREESEAARIVFDRSHGLVQVVGDAVRTSQIMDNLLSNALKYSRPDDRVAVSLTVVATAAGPVSQVRVSDEGIGIQCEERAQLFTPFYRAASARGTAGSGLGLHISRRLAERQAGRLVLEASSSAGSVFLLELPLSTVAT